MPTLICDNYKRSLDVSDIVDGRRRTTPYWGCAALRSECNGGADRKLGSAIPRFDLRWYISMRSTEVSKLRGQLSEGDDEPSEMHDFLNDRSTQGDTLSHPGPGSNDFIAPTFLSPSGPRSRS